MAVIDDFKAQFPEFDATTVDNNATVLQELQTALFNRPYDQNKQATLHLMAHLFVTQFQGTAGSGPSRAVNSKSAGSVSASYEALSEAPDMSEEWLRTTRYGQLFLLLTRNYAQGAVSV